MSHRTHLAVLLVPPWESRLLAVADQLLILFPTGWARPPLAPLPMVTPFPSGSTHSPTPPSATGTYRHVCMYNIRHQIRSHLLSEVIQRNVQKSLTTAHTFWRRGQKAWVRSGKTASTTFLSSKNPSPYYAFMSSSLFSSLSSSLFLFSLTN
jgi:hypothetical protein